jgi:hypothetical protein
LEALVGLALEFIIGNTEAIIGALQAEDFEWMEDRTLIQARADFSLHIVPSDLNLLSHAIGIHTGQPLQDLRPLLTGLVDTETFGALAVDPAWIAYVAVLPPERIPAVVETWFELMRVEHNQPRLQVTPDAKQAVEELLTLCQLSQVIRSDVIHFWYL